MTIPDPIRAVGRMIKGGVQTLGVLLAMAVPVLTLLYGIPWAIAWVLGAHVGEVMLTIVFLAFVAGCLTCLFLWIKEIYEAHMLDIRIERRWKERDISE